MNRYSLRSQQAKRLVCERLETRAMLAATPVAPDWLLELPSNFPSSSGATLHDTAVDVAGNLVVLGEFTGTVDFDPGGNSHELTSSSTPDLFVAMYDADGALINVVDVGDFQIGTNGEPSIALDGMGNIYLASGYRGTATLLGGVTVAPQEAPDEAVLFAKLDAGMTRIEWATQASLDAWGPFSRSEMRVQDIAVDAAGGGVYVVGIQVGAGNIGSIPVKQNLDGFIERLDGQTGDFTWVEPLVGKSWINGVAVDPADPTAIYAFEDRNGINDPALMRFNDGGAMDWEVQFPNNVAWGDIDAASGGIFLAGTLLSGSATLGPTTLVSVGSTDALVARINPDTGAVTWASSAGGINNDGASSISVDSAGNVFLGGAFQGIAQFGNETLAASTTSGTTYETYLGDVYLSQLDSSDGSFLQSWRYGRATVEDVASGGGNMFAVGLFNATSVDFPTGDVATASSGFFNYAMKFEPASDPTIPRINGFVAATDPAEQGHPIALEVLGMYDPDARVDSVAFYHDVDGDRHLDPVVDELLGSDSNGADGWAFDAPTAGLPLGEVQFLAQATYDGGASSLAASAAAFLRLPSTTYVSNDVGQQIRDLSTMTSTIHVPDSFELGDVDVTLTITHSFEADLDVFLIHPNGTRVELFTDVGSSSRDFPHEDFIDTTLDDQADLRITSGQAPFTGRFQPEGLLSLLNGDDASGTWVLEVTDDYRHDIGTLVGWSLTLAPATPVAPSLSIDDVTLTEGDSGSTTAKFTVTRSGDLSQTVSVDYQTADDTATAGSDYTAIPATTLTFDPGVASLPVSVSVNGDVNQEPDETFFVNLSNAVGATISDAQGVGTIVDDDAVAELGTLYVYDIRFESKRHDRDWRAVVEVWDVDGNAVEGVSLKVDFAGTTYTLTTDANGIARTSWERNLASGDYYADAYDLALTGYFWDPFAFDNEDDSDGDGKPDDVLMF